MRIPFFNKKQQPVADFSIMGVAPTFQLSDKTGVAIAATNPFNVQIGDGTTQVGVQTGTKKAIYVAHTDGTNVQPSMDAAARRGYVTITDGTNSMPTMDAIARAGFVKLTDGTNVAPLRATGTNYSVNVAIVDGSGTQITSFGGGTQYTDNTTSFPAGSGVLTGVGYLFDDTPPTALSTISRAAAGRVTANRAQHVNLRNASGTELGLNASPVQTQVGDGTNQVTVRSLASAKALNVSIVDASGNQITSFSGGASFSDRGAFTAGTSSISPVGGLFDDTPPTTLTTGMAGAFRLTANRALHMNIRGSNGNEAWVAPYGYLRVTEEPSTLFYDPFDGAVDVTNKWNAAVTSGTGASFSQTTGTQILTSGTSNSGYAYESSQASFVQSVPGFLQVSWAMKWESGTANSNCHRFFGVGTPGVSFAATTPLTDAIGWEIDTTGKLQACVYANGTRIFNADLSASGTNKQPTDGAYRRYVCVQRTDRIYWFIDTLDVPVATCSFLGPQVQTLPIRMHAINTAAGVTSSQLICSGMAVADTARNGVQISDGTNPWKKVNLTSVSGNYALNVNVVQSVGNPLPVAADNTASNFTSGTTYISPIGAVYDDTLTVTTTRAAGLRMNKSRALYTDIVSDNGAKAIVDPQGHLMVRERSSVLFTDPMATNVVDAVKWNTSTGGNGTVTQAVGNMVLANTGTTASSFAQAVSMPTFTPQGTQEALLDVGVLLPTNATNQAVLYWGYGTKQTTPTAALPVLDFIGFSYNSSTGALTSTIWANGVVVASTTTTLTTPTLNQYTRFRVAWTSQNIYWYVTDMDTPVATLTTAQAFLPSSSGFSRNDLSVLCLIVAQTPTAVATTMKFTNLLVGDVGRNNFQLSDAVNPWRQAQINAAGGLAIGSNYASKAIVNPEGRLNVIQPPSVLFSDPINGAVVDITNRWTTSTLNGGAVAQANGDITLSTVVTAANQYAVLVSQPSYSPEGMEDLLMGWGALLPTSGANKSTVFMGFGTKPATPSPTIPVTDGIGFLYDPTANAGAGSLTAVYFANTSKVTVATLTVPSAAWHRYRITWDSQSIYWYIDDVDTPVASSTNFAFPAAATASNLLNVNFTMAGVTSASAVVTSLQIAGMIVGNTAKNTLTLCDSTYRWRRIAVNASGALMVQTANVGRAPLTFAVAGVTGVAAVTLFSFGQTKSGTATAGVTSYSITAGKTFRITSITVAFTSSTTTANTALIAIRSNNAGATTTASNLIWTTRLALPTGTLAANQGSQEITVSFPEGLDITNAVGGTASFGVTHTEAAANGLLDCSITGYEF